MAYIRLSLLACALLGMAACDIVRYPGDGGAEPATPDAGPELPAGAPGPPPPAIPVTDPYDEDNDGDVGEVDVPITPDETPVDTVPPVVDADDETDDTPPIDAPTDTTDPVDGGDTQSDLTDTNGEDTPPETDTGDPSVPEDVETPEPEPETPEPNVPEPEAPEPDVPETPEPPVVVEPAFSYHAPGRLLPGTGQGQIEQIVHAPDMVFPIADAPAYLQSMVFTFGGGVGGGDQCDARNYGYPWRDNFCETRSRTRTSPFCPTSKIHQGQDIRVGTPGDCNTLRRASASDRTLHKVVAVEDGVISHIGSYSVNLRAGGRIYKYMHMNMKALQVSVGQAVTAGDHLGYVSNDFGGTPTTFHLHFEITQNTSESGWAHVPPYLSLVEAYERRENGPGEVIDTGDVAVAAAPIVIPEGFEIIE